MTTVSEDAGHPPEVAEVKMSFIFLTMVSALPGVYLAFKVVLFGVNVPLPFVVVQVPVPLPPVIVPFSCAKLFVQVAISVPAWAIGAGANATVIVSFTMEQFPLLDDVRI